MSNNSISLHRVLKATPEKVFRAFSDPDAYAAWIPPYGFLCVIQNIDFKTGGNFKMSFKNFTTGNSHSFGGSYLNIKTNEQIKITEKFDNPDLHGDMITTITFKEVSCGTELTVSQEGIPSVIPTEMCYLGWQESLDKLIKLVEPVIPDA